MNRNEAETATLNPLRLIPMRCSSKLPARYPDAGLHTETEGGSKWLQRVEHIVLPRAEDPASEEKLIRSKLRI